MIFTVYSLHFSDIELIRSFDVFFIIVFSKYHAYRQLSIFCHARLKSIFLRNDSSESQLVIYETVKDDEKIMLLFVDEKYEKKFENCVVTRDYRLQNRLTNKVKVVT